MLKGRTAVITGSTQGLGYAMAARLAAQGCNIVLNGLGEPSEIEEKRRQLMAKHGLTRERAVKEFLGSRQPSRRFVAMEGVAGLAAFLCGPEGSDVNGAVLPIDGAGSAS